MSLYAFIPRSDLAKKMKRKPWSRLQTRSHITGAGFHQNSNPESHNRTLTRTGSEARSRNHTPSPSESGATTGQDPGSGTQGVSCSVGPSLDMGPSLEDPGLRFRFCCQTKMRMDVFKDLFSSVEVAVLQYRFSQALQVLSRV